MKKIHFIPILLLALTFTSATAQSPALRHFMAMYGSIPNVGITPQQNDDLLFRWKKDSSSYKALFDKDGKWINTIISYWGSQLPKTVRLQVETAYPDYQLGWVDELRFPGRSPVYRVQLDAPATLLFVQVNEDAMVEEKRLRKNP